MNGFSRFSQYSAVKTDRNPEKMYTREFIGIECPVLPCLVGNHLLIKENQKEREIGCITKLKLPKEKY